MDNRQTITAEIKSMAPTLAGIGNAMPYTLPEGYFDLLPLTMVSKLAGPVEQPAVPAGYFDSFPAMMLARAKASVSEFQAELQEVAPLLNTISKDMPYHLPEGYFESLAITAPVAETAPVVPIQSGNKRWLWAVAACVVALLGLFAWQNLWYAPASSNAVMASQGNSDSVEITELASALEDISDTSINSALEERNFSEDFASALYYINTDNFETALKGISTEEIKAQLTESGYPVSKS